MDENKMCTTLKLNVLLYVTLSNIFYYCTSLSYQTLLITITPCWVCFNRVWRYLILSLLNILALNWKPAVATSFPPNNNWRFKLSKQFFLGIASNDDVPSILWLHSRDVCRLRDTSNTFEKKKFFLQLMP